MHSSFSITSFLGPVKYDYFYNYSVTSLPPYANADVHNNVNVSACVDLCTETGQCAGFTHNPTGATCTILHLDQGYGYMTYTVLPGSDHTRHGYKIRSKRKSHFYYHIHDIAST